MPYGSYDRAKAKAITLIVHREQDSNGIESVTLSEYKFWMIDRRTCRTDEVRRGQT